MTDFPIPLDNLITYVRSLHGGAGPLDHLTDAVRVAASLNEQSDDLIGYFVEEARQAGAPWSEIGASMGVSKQAVQKRFVAKPDLDDFDPDTKPFSRFTDRAKHVVWAARLTAITAGADATEARHLAVGLLAEPEGIAAKVIHSVNISDAEYTSAFGIELADSSKEVPAPGLVPFSTDAKIAFRESLKSAVRLGHNYIGTEHLILGLLREGGDVASTFERLGLALPAVEKLVNSELDKLTKRRR